MFCCPYCAIKRNMCLSGVHGRTIGSDRYKVNIKIFLSKRFLSFPKKERYTIKMNKEIITLELTSLSHDGRAVGRVDSRVVFVEHALPGQVVRASIHKSKKTFAEATCLEVIEEASYSIPAPCPHAQNCGGCALQTMPQDVQLLWKERIIHEAMTRIAKLSPEQSACIAPIVPSPQAWEYRNKMEFAFGQNSDGSLVLGLRAKGSHDVMAVPHCKLMPKECIQILQQVTNLCQDAGLHAWTDAQRSAPKPAPKNILRHLIIRRPHTLQPDGKAQIVVNLITAPAPKELRLRLSRLGKDLMQSCRAITGFLHEERRSASMLAQGEQTITKMGNPLLQETLGKVNYTLGHTAFFQINTNAAHALCDEIIAMVNPSAYADKSPCIWDLYCGVGAPGLNLAHSFGKEPFTLYGVEINSHAITFAKKNAQALDNNTTEYVAADTKKALQHWPAPDIILLDPPRTGIAPEVAQAILQSQAPCLIYVSCNPATLARDMATLSEAYTLQKLVPFDFFPQTPHVESCALLVRK